MDKMEFLRREREFISEVHKKELEIMNGKRGIKSIVPEKGFTSGYVIYLSYSDNNSVVLGNLSDKISDIFEGAITYGLKDSWWGVDQAHKTDTIHTSLGTFNVKHRDEFRQDHKILKSLTESVQEGLDIFINNGNYYTPQVIFDRISYDDTGVMLTPTGSLETYYPFLASVVENSKKRGINLNLPKGRQIPLLKFNRYFKANSKDLMDRLAEYHRIINRENFLIATSQTANEETFEFENKESNLEDYARAVNVGFFILGKEGFVLEPYSTFHFNPIRSPGIASENPKNKKNYLN